MTRRCAARCGGLLAAACALAAGCLAPPAPPDRIYRLELAPPPRLAVPALSGTLEVERLRADSAARGTALAVLLDASSREVRTRPYDHWADSPTLLVQRQMTGFLRAAGLAREVVTPELGIEPEFRLSGTLARFEEVRGPGAPHVVVELEIAITDLGRGAIALRTTYREERPVEGSGVEDAVRAYQAALSAALAGLVADASAAARP